MTKQIKVMVKKYADGYGAYPLGVNGVVVDKGLSYESVLADIHTHGTTITFKHL